MNDHHSLKYFVSCDKTLHELSLFISAINKTRGNAMASPNVTVRVSGSLREHLEACTGPNGDYETPSEYLRDLIRRDMEKKESEKWERVRSALTEGLDIKDDEYQSVTREDFKKRSRARRGIDG